MGYDINRYADPEYSGGRLIAESGVVVEDNGARGGAAIEVHSGSVDLREATIQTNQNDGGTGAIELFYAEATLGPGARIVDNHGGECGGMSLVDSEVFVSQSEVAGNTGSDAAGACVWGSGESVLNSEHGQWGESEDVDISVEGIGVYQYGVDATFGCDNTDGCG